MLTFSVTQFHVALGIVVFSIGVLGFLFRRSGLIVMMSLELMLNGVNLCLIGFAKHHQSPQGSALFLFIILVAAAEAAIALSLLVALHRRLKTVFLDEFRLLKG
jgi:NADH-quinone oxidoreductase subunit K